MPWASSTISQASCRRASAASSGSGAMSPSMLKTPSVITSLSAARLAASFASSAVTSPCG